PEEMAKHRSSFVAGAAANGLPERKSNELFDLMEKFAGYGFNKSHAAAYALVAYQTAYMKTHHPAAFAAANLSAVMSDTDKAQQSHGWRRASRQKLLPPNTTAGALLSARAAAPPARWGPGAERGPGEPAAAAILDARAGGGPSPILFFFGERVKRRIVNRR